MTKYINNMAELEKALMGEMTKMVDEIDKNTHAKCQYKGDHHIKHTHCCYIGKKT